MKEENSGPTIFLMNILERLLTCFLGSVDDAMSIYYQSWFGNNTASESAAIKIVNDDSTVIQLNQEQQKTFRKYFCPLLAK